MKDEIPPRPALLWQGRLLGRSGQAVNTRDILREFARRPLAVSFRHLVPEAEQDAEVTSSFWYRKITREPVVPGSVYVVFHTAAGQTGAGFFREARAMNPGHCRYVGYTEFESDRIHPSWVEACDAMDEIWVPTRFNAGTFARSGVPAEKIRVMPLGIDPERFDPERASPLRPPTGKTFNFLSVFEWTYRKGWDVLLRAFAEEFSASDDVALTLAAYRGGGANRRRVVSLQDEVRRFLEGKCGLDPARLPAIRVAEEPVPDERWGDLFAGHDAFVLPTRGEGWGLPIMEAMAMGLPVAATRWSGQMEFLNSEVAYLIEVDGLREVGLEQIRDNPLFAGHRWAEPSIASTRQAMRRIFEDRAGAREMGQRARAHVLENFSVQRVVDRMEARVRELTAASARPAFFPGGGNASPLRLLWMGSHPARDGLNLLLSCYCATFEAEDPVTLAVASVSAEADEAIRRTVLAFSRLSPRPIQFTAAARSESEREGLLRSVDLLAVPTSVDAVSPFCLEAASIGVPILASEGAIPSSLRGEGRSLAIPCLKVRAGQGLGRRFVCKPLPNVLGSLMRWAFCHRLGLRSLGAEASVCLRTVDPPGASGGEVPWVSAEPSGRAGEGFSLRASGGTQEGGGIAGLGNRELSRTKGEFLAVTVGKALPSRTGLEALRADPQAAAFYEERGTGAALIVRIRRAGPFCDFEPRLEGRACLREFARSIRCQGGKVLSPLDLDREGALSEDSACLAVLHAEKAGRYWQAGKKEEAVVALRRALELEANYPEALFHLARLLWERRRAGDGEEAEATLWRLVAVKPLHAAGRQLLGGICFSKGALEEAAENLDVASKVESEDPLIWNDLGVVLASRGDLEEALGCFEKGRSLEGETLDALKNGAEVLAALGDRARALQWLEEAEARAPGDSEVRALADSLAMEGTRKA